MNQTTADGIKAEVRKFYGIGQAAREELGLAAPEPKSNNKHYANSSPVPDVKKQTRNDNINKSGALRTHQTDYARRKKISLLQMGQYLSVQVRGQRVGNCAEMAMLAVHFAVTKYGQSQDTAFVCTRYAPTKWLMRKSFSHQFAFFGDKSAVRADGGIDLTLYQQGWIVDPWCNIACLVSQYEGLVGTKLAKWKSEGKEICAYSFDVAAPGWSKPTWVKPDDGRITGIFGGKSSLSLNKATDTPEW